MTVKMIAVDMDGTFLNSNQEYDKQRFEKAYQEMDKQGVKFVVASGNQYYQLKSFFPEIAQEISFVAENGAYVVSEEKEIFYGEMDRETVLNVLQILESFEEGHVLLCGKNSAYVSEKEPESFVQHASKYYHKMEKVADLTEIKDDVLFKFALSFPVEQVEEVLEQLKLALGDLIIPVSSGHGDVDLIIRDVHKASGLERLQQLWGIEASEIAAFGDSGNDLEMLKHAGYSYAMGNAQEKIKEAAKETIQTNDENGVLVKIEELLTNQK